MRKDTQAGAHVELPDDVGRRGVLEDLLLIRTTVLAVAETLRVEGTELALGGDVVQTVPFHVRRTCRRRQQELPQAALHSRGHVLPEERAIRHAKGHEHAALFFEVGVHVTGVVGTRHRPRRRPPRDGHTCAFPTRRSRRCSARWSYPSQPEDCPCAATVVWGCGATEGAGARGRDDRLSRLDAGDSTQRPLGFVTQGGIVGGRSQRLPGRLCLWPDAAQRPGREDAHVEEFIRQRDDQLRHGGLRGGADAGEGLTRRPSDAGNRIGQGPGEIRRSLRSQPDRWRPGPPPRRRGRSRPRARAS